jgi:Tol biopolymer transport system component
VEAVSREAWRLTAAEVYGRLEIAGVSLSPDGGTLAYTRVRDRRAEEDREGKRITETPAGDVYLLPAAGGHPRRLTGSDDVSQSPVWAPGGDHLLVERQNQLQVISAAAGEPAKPVVLHGGAIYRPRVAPGDAPLAGPRFSPDGRWILAATRDAPETTLVLFSADGRLRRSLLTVEG